MSLMEWRGVTTTNVYIGNFFFIAGIGMLISAQWELVKGNSFAYTVLSAFGSYTVLRMEAKANKGQACSTPALEQSSHLLLGLRTHTVEIQPSTTMLSVSGFCVSNNPSLLVTKS